MLFLVFGAACMRERQTIPVRPFPILTYMSLSELSLIAHSMSCMCTHASRRATHAPTGSRPTWRLSPSRLGQGSHLSNPTGFGRALIVHKSRVCPTRWVESTLAAATLSIE